MQVSSGQDSYSAKILPLEVKRGLAEAYVPSAMAMYTEQRIVKKADSRIVWALK